MIVEIKYCNSTIEDLEKEVKTVIENNEIRWKLFHLVPQEKLIRVDLDDGDVGNKDILDIIKSASEDICLAEVIEEEEKEKLPTSLIEAAKKLVEVNYKFGPSSEEYEELLDSDPEKAEFLEDIANIRNDLENLGYDV